MRRVSGLCVQSGAIQQVEDGFLVHYYHSNGTPICLNSGKIIKVLYDELN